MADGRSLVARNRSRRHEHGNRSTATAEAPAYDNIEQAIVAATELDTDVSCALDNTERVLKNVGSIACWRLSATGASLQNLLYPPGRGSLPEA